MFNDCTSMNVNDTCNNMKMIFTIFVEIIQIKIMIDKNLTIYVNLLDHATNREIDCENYDKIREKGKNVKNSKLCCNMLSSWT